jgi:hypothetical protein
MESQRPDARTRQQFMDAIITAIAASPEQGGFGWHLISLFLDSESDRIGELTFENWRPYIGNAGRRTVAVKVVVLDGGPFGLGATPHVLQ